MSETIITNTLTNEQEEILSHQQPAVALGTTTSGSTILDVQPSEKVTIDLDHTPVEDGGKKVNKVSINLTIAQLNKLKLIAEEKEISVPELIRRIILQLP